MSLLAYHHARRRAALSLNYAGDFSSGVTASQDMSGLPTIGDLDFRVQVRVNLQNYVYGNFIGGNATESLETFCIFQRNGELIAYCQARTSNKSIFRPLNTAAQAPIGKFVHAGYERIGDTIYGLFNEQRVWAQQVGTFTVDPLTALNISRRGGGGGGEDTRHYLDYLTLELGTGPGGSLERWLDYQFNEPSGEDPLNAGRLGGHFSPSQALGRILL